MRKKIIALIMICVFAFSLAACGNADEKEEINDNQNSSESVETTEIKDKTGDEDTGKTIDTDIMEDSRLVVYFSNTGNTESAAQVIAEKAGADIAEIKRSKEYGDLQAEAEAEIQNKEYPDISVDVENLSQYQTIFVGYPIWFDEAPAMIATFLAENDFSEKTIVPFCTSAGDSIDNSLHIFKELSPNAEILKGLTVENETDIEPWLEKLGFLS